MKPWVLLGAAFLSGACARSNESPAAETVERVQFVVTTPQGRAVPGARIVFDGSELGTTDDAGNLEAQVRGGEVPHGVELHCPEHHRPERSTHRVVLQRTLGLDGQPLVAPIRLVCEATRVPTVVVVRTTHATHVPVLVQGAAVGDTGPDGVLHYLTTAPPHSELRVELDTAGRPELGPALSRTFSVADEETLLALDVEFERPKPPRRAAPRRPTPVRQVPYRLD